jgi:hypothetical protein
MVVGIDEHEIEDNTETILQLMFDAPASTTRSILGDLQARRRGAEFLHSGASDEVSRLYERSALGYATREYFLSAQAFQQLADLASAPIREIVRGLPSRDLNRVAARPR